MKTEVLYHEDLHFEHQQWHSELDFWEDELKSFKNRLEELIKRWSSKEVLSQLEHFQNEFLIHGKVINELQETIEKHELRIAEQTKTGHNAMDIDLSKKHVEFRDKIETQRQIYADLKKDFFRFLTKYM